MSDCFRGSYAVWSCLSQWGLVPPPRPKPCKKLWAAGCNRNTTYSSSTQQCPNPLISNISECIVFLFKHLLCQLDCDRSTCVHTVVGFQLVLEAELLPTAVTFIGLLPSVDAFVALQRALISKAAPAELALVWVVPCWNVEKKKRSLLQLQSRPCCKKAREIENLRA